MRPILLAATIVLAMFSGCFGEDVEPVQVSEFSVEAPESVLRGQYFSIEVSSDVDWTMNRSPGFYFMDEYDVLRDDVEATFDASQTSLTFLVLDSERSDIALTITSGEDAVSYTHLRAHETSWNRVCGRQL